MAMIDAKVLRTPWRNIFVIIFGAALSVLSVVLVGILEIQTVGLRGGVVFDLFNEVVTVVSPNVGLLQMLGSATVIGACAFLVLSWSGRWGVRQRILFRTSFVVIVLVSAVWASLLLMDSIPESSVLRLDAAFLGWIQHGGANVGLIGVSFAGAWLLVVDVLSIFEEKRSSRTGQESQESLRSRAGGVESGSLPLEN